MSDIKLSREIVVKEAGVADATAVMERLCLLDADGCVFTSEVNERLKRYFASMSDKDTEGLSAEQIAGADDIVIEGNSKLLDFSTTTSSKRKKKFAHIFAGVFYVASLPTETLSRARAKTSEGSESVVAATSMLAGVGQTLVDVLGTRVP